MTITIDKDVPLPDGQAKLPFGIMDIGDSFFVNGYSHNMDTVRSAASAWGQRHQKRFTVRVVDGGVRIWRIE